MPVEEFTLRTLQDCFRKRRGTGTEVIGSLAHIQSHSDLVGLQSCSVTLCFRSGPLWELACLRYRRLGTSVIPW